MRNIIQLCRAVIFNVLIGNNDAHAKNFSLLRYPNGRIDLAPFYDLVSTEVYPQFKGGAMAMRFGGIYNFKRLAQRHILALAKDMTLSLSQLRKIIDFMCVQLPPMADSLARECGWPVGEQIASIVDLRAALLQKTILQLSQETSRSAEDVVDEFEMALEDLRRANAKAMPSPSLSPDVPCDDECPYPRC